ncbi:alpha/beta hydrolase fold-3 protein [gamma proteobacterium HdN1]|nr:alpha/beta hydrolase fold-3 protein [gamma proteobacterium HdN1]
MSIFTNQILRRITVADLQKFKIGKFERKGLETLLSSKRVTGARLWMEHQFLAQVNRLPHAMLYRLMGGRPETLGTRTLGAEMQAIAFTSRRMKPFHEYPKDAMRVRYQYVSRMMGRQGPPALQVRRKRIHLNSVAGGDRWLQIRTYTPAQTRLPRPMLVYFHGGGWCIGGADTHEDFCLYIAERTNMAVVSVDYRLAPEHPYPLPVEDVIDAWQWIAEHAAMLGGDERYLLVGGDSAGGNLSAVLCQQAYLRGFRMPAGQVLLYPSTDMRCQHASHQEMGDDYLLTGKWIHWFITSYLQSNQKRVEPQASPLLADFEVFRHQPPAIVVTCGFDPLRDEGEEYAEKLSAAGVSVDYHEFSHLLHGFIGMLGVSGQAISAANTISAQILGLLARLEGIQNS